MQEEKKRKTHTSTEVKRRYNEKTYDRLVINVHKGTAATFKEKCKQNGDTYSSVLKKAIDDYLEK